MVVVDIDGTLVDKNGKMAEEDKQAIRRLIYSSITVVLCTGRVVQATVPIIDELGLDTYNIFYDGAFIANTNTKCKLYTKPIDATLIREMVDFCRQNNIYVELYANGASFSPDHILGTHWSETINTDLLFVERPHWSKATHHEFFRIEPTVVNFDDIIGKKDILKAEMLVSSDDEAIQARQLKDYFMDRFNYSIVYSPAFPDVHFINIPHPQVSKGAALKELIDYWGYPPADIIAIGDGLNDISLLEKVGGSVAMGNACDELKQVANFITNTVEEHGVATAINFLFQF